MAAATGDGRAPSAAGCRMPSLAVSFITGYCSVKLCEAWLRYGEFHSYIEAKPLSSLLPAQERKGSERRHLLVRCGVVGGVAWRGALNPGGVRGACTWCLLEAMDLRVAA